MSLKCNRRPENRCKNEQDIDVSKKCLEEQKIRIILTMAKIERW